MNELLTSLRLVLLSLVVCCVAYPSALLAFARLAIPWRAEGSLITDAQGRIIGSHSVAQNFTRPGYFWPRPSAVDYNASAAGGSNLSPANPELATRAKAIIERHAPPAGRVVPADLVTASGSGLDPHISLRAARFQIPRVAGARKIPEAEVQTLILDSAESPSMRVFGGEPVVNVMKLNLALDGLGSARER